SLSRLYLGRFSNVHIGGPSSNQATSLESQMIHPIQLLPGRTLSDEVLHDILNLFRYETVCKGDSSIALEDVDRLFYLVVSGRAKVAAHHPDTGREHIFYLLGPGDGFDLINLLSGTPQDVIVTALDDMEVLTTPLSRARDWLNHQPNFNRTFLPYLGEQMRKLADNIEDLALYDTEARLARLILRHLTSASPVHGLRLINDLSQEAIASMIGSVRVVVAQHVNAWKKKGILSGGRGTWSVADLPALLEKAERRFNRSAHKSP
ncbi:MAG: Crp/Fnr family transcriptional regulator, partial [Methylocella sp.]